MKTHERGPDKPEQVTADIAYEILLELKTINAQLEGASSKDAKHTAKTPAKKKWPK
jgi:hypothetical protein